MPPFTGNVTLRGPLFSKNIRGEVRDAILAEAMEKFEKRVRRKGRKIGRKRNPIGPGDFSGRDVMVLEMTSTLNWPRASGGSWTRKNIAAIKAMSPRVLRSVANRIVMELS